MGHVQHERVTLSLGPIDGREDRLSQRTILSVAHNADNLEFRFCQAAHPRTEDLAYRIRIWEKPAGRQVKTKLGNHSFRATGITAYLKNPNSRLEVAQHLANHESPRTTKALQSARRGEIHLPKSAHL
jgi:integrase